MSDCGNKNNNFDSALCYCVLLVPSYYLMQTFSWSLKEKQKQLKMTAVTEAMRVYLHRSPRNQGNSKCFA